MANFAYYTATYADGHTERGQIRLWCLGGTKDEEGHAKLAKLRADEVTGIITKLFVDYES